VVATKVFFPLRDHPNSGGLSRKSIMANIDASLKRLGMDHVDLYQIHRWDYTTPIEETLEALHDIVKAGKVRYIGASNMEPDRLRANMAASASSNLPAYSVFQPGYSLVNRKGYEQGIGPLCREYKLGVIPYFPLASGFLSGKYRSEADLGQSVRGGGVKKYLTAEGQAVLDALDHVAGKHGVSPAGVSLAWLLAQPGISAPIASVTKPAHLTAFGEAAELQLEAEDLALLDNASRPFA
jgi:aryl-alcohol dehydrogenase-like predicted oxidoreductase